jgi:hypothetical protein
LSHNCIHSDEFTTIDLGSGREQVGVTQGRPELNPAGTSAGTRLWKLTKPYSSNWLGLEARVGIGRLTPCLRGKFTPLFPLFQHTPALFTLTWFNSVTEDFTEGFWRVKSPISAGRAAVFTVAIGRNSLCAILHPIPLLFMETPRHYAELTPAQLHHAKTTVFLAKADLTPPSRRAGAGLGSCKSASQQMAEAALSRLNQPEIKR